MPAEALALADPAPQSVAWAAFPGSQTAFLACPFFEVLYDGERGPGKTDALLMDFARDVRRGHGAKWRGILFRRAYPELAEVVEKSREFFPKAFPGARFKAAGSLGYSAAVE
jgi:hypothetical protein